MKVTFVANQFFFFRHIEPVASALVKDGHRVAFWFGDLEKGNITDRAVLRFVTRYSDMAYSRNLTRYTNGRFRYFFRVIRELTGYHTYLIPGFTSFSKKRIFEKKMSYLTRLLIAIPKFELILKSDKIQRFLRNILKNAPVDQRICNELIEDRPDLLVAITNLREDSKAPELDYVHAAMKLGIQTVDLVASWDNLSTKSTFNIIPTAIVLWNESMREEAVKLHKVPTEKIIVSGAETFDYLFNIKETCTRAEFCRKIDIENRPFVVYLGSSSSMTGDETGFVREFVGALWEKLGIYTLIRPHPLNAGIWSGFEEIGSVIWPKGGDLPDVDQAQQDLWDTFHYSSAVVGINTSAMIEAAIADRPCITIKSGQYSASQSETGHFRHLLNGNFLEVADNFDHAVVLIENILKGKDHLAFQRKAFVSNFIRPNGIDQPVGPLIAQALELLFQGRSPLQIQSQISTIAENA